MGVSLRYDTVFIKKYLLQIINVDDNIVRLIFLNFYRNWTINNKKRKWFAPIPLISSIGSTKTYSRDTTFH